MNKKLIACLTTVALFLAMLATTAFAAKAETKDLQDGVDWERGVIRATGLGSGKASSAKLEGVFRAQARRAAMMDAMRNLAESVKGVRVTSESTMRDLELEYDIVRVSVDTTIQGMTEISERYFKDNTCEVVLEMPLFGGPKSLAASAFLPAKAEPKVPFPQPSTTANITANVTVTQNGVVNGASNSVYTGLVIDCSGMDLNPVMSPVIKNNDGQAIYGHRNLDIDKVIELGMASYAEASNDAISRERAGDNPLVVKAVKLDGFNANPVVSVADADRILLANQKDMFLDNCAVVFVK